MNAKGGDGKLYRVGRVWRPMGQRPVSIFLLIPPPIQFALTFLAGLALNWFFHWRPEWTEIEGVRWIGWVVAAAGIVLFFFAGRGLEVRQASDGSDHIVIGGAHAWSRNPAYLGLIFAYAGVALGLGVVWPLVLLILPFASLNWVVIPFEEACQLEILGQEYARYCRIVRRWI
jgi:protein-S-isoprenylcysteine O-methyltransferase Ste14